MASLSEKLGDMTYDNLIAGLNPKKRVGAATIAGPAADTTFMRGTVFAKSTSTGKLSILGTTAAENDTMTPDCILCDDVTVKKTTDINVPVYLAGLFNIDAVAVKAGYTMTEADKDKLRERGIAFTGVSDAE